MTSENYLRVVRASAWYDVAATAAFTTPWTFAAVHRALNAVADAVGASRLPAFGAEHMLFANLLGSVVLVWAALRLWRTTAAYGVFDGVARVLFLTWQAVALANGASALVWPFLMFEAAFAVAQLLPWLGRGLRAVATVRPPGAASGR